MQIPGAATVCAWSAALTAKSLNDAYVSSVPLVVLLLLVSKAVVPRYEHAHAKAPPWLEEVPAAAIEHRAGTPKPTPAELEAHIRARLTAPHVPVRFLILDALPRTASMKPSLTDIKRLFEAAA